MALSLGARKYTEQEIRGYHQTLKEIEIRRQEIMHPYRETDTNVGGGKSNLPGDPTGRIGTALTADLKLKNLEHVIESIDYVWQDLPDEKKQFVKLYYWTRPQRYTLEGVAIKLSISDRTAKRWRTEFVERVADQIGLR